MWKLLVVCPSPHWCKPTFSPTTCGLASSQCAQKKCVQNLRMRVFSTVEGFVRHGGAFFFYHEGGDIYFLPKPSLRALLCVTHCNLCGSPGAGEHRCPLFMTPVGGGRQVNSGAGRASGARLETTSQWLFNTNEAPNQAAKLPTRRSGPLVSQLGWISGEREEGCRSSRHLPRAALSRLHRRQRPGPK